MSSVSVGLGDNAMSNNDSSNQHPDPNELVSPPPTKTLSWKDKLDKEVSSRPFAVKTKLGAFNPFGLYYGMLSIFLGIIWYAATMTYALVYYLSRGKIDRNRRVPIFLGHVWGWINLRLARSYPVIENREVLDNLYNDNRAAMFVANHNSWMDIPFLGASIGWRNYKMVAKQELTKVPILGPCMTIAGHVLLSRKDRRSQLNTLKTGIDWLKRGVHLCTFPEGTRSKSGRLLKFKNGAFKMAYKAGAPIVPVSIVGSGIVMPPGWIFPVQPARGVGKVIIHEPIESTGKTEDELATQVRDAIISGLPEEQRPLVA
eukprot:CAMPEP_0196823190 /NCGR_PEP_ID=MMETSP1362-20130617/86482_1 /TAXON_ID=163516 /ORGANISM="Leptocylindrus danicus, Strain CCMP1856" /LENGTH=314 /DNA_ID=CAMNT_0042202981 /DNA_START=27 /DNA_END=971 /DNA_ORIENTATION=-